MMMDAKEVLCLYPLQEDTFLQPQQIQHEKKCTLIKCALCAMPCPSAEAVSFCSVHQFCSDCAEQKAVKGLSSCLFCPTIALPSNNTLDTPPPCPPLCSPSLPFPFPPSHSSNSSSSLSLHFSPSLFNNISSSSSSLSLPVQPGTLSGELQLEVPRQQIEDTNARESLSALSTVSHESQKEEPFLQGGQGLIPNDAFFFNSQSPEYEDDFEIPERDQDEEEGVRTFYGVSDEDGGGDDSSDFGDLSLLIESEHPSLYADIQFDGEKNNDSPVDFVDLEFDEVVPPEPQKQIERKTARSTIFSRWDGLSKKSNTTKTATISQSSVDGWISKKKKKTTPSTTVAVVSAEKKGKGKGKGKERKRKREKKAEEKGKGKETRKKRQRIGSSSDKDDEGNENVYTSSLGTSVIAIVDNLKQERETKNEREKKAEDIFAFVDEDEEEAERIAWRKASKKLSQSSLEDFCFRLILPRLEKAEEKQNEMKEETRKEETRKEEREKEKEKENEPVRPLKHQVLSQTDMGENRSEIPKTRIVLLGTGLPKESQKDLKAATSQLGGRIVTNFSDDVTHVITVPDEHTGAAKRTIKYFNAIIGAKWIVSYDWVIASSVAGYWVNEEAYEIEGDSIAKGGPRKGRLREQPQHLQQHPQHPQQPQHDPHAPLFKGFCFCFHSSAFNAPYPSKPELQDLVKRGGGKVISRLPLKKKKTDKIKNEKEKRKKVEKENELEMGMEEIPLQNIVVCDPSSMTAEEAKDIEKKCGEAPISVEWILSSISHYDLLPFSLFRLC